MKGFYLLLIGVRRDWYKEYVRWEAVWEVV